MKKQYSVSITDGSAVARFLDGLGHKRGIVLETMLAQHLKEFKGYLSPEVAIEAGYKFSDRDTEFARWYQGGDGAQEEAGKAGKKRRQDGTAARKVVKRRNPGDETRQDVGTGRIDGDKGVKESEKFVESPVVEINRASDGPEVKNRDLVMAGLSAFLG